MSSNPKRSSYSRFFSIMHDDNDYDSPTVLFQASNLPTRSDWRTGWVTGWLAGCLGI